MSNPRKRFRIGLFVCSLLALLVYGLFQAKNLIEGPEVVILEPSNGAELSSEVVTVKGTARNISYIWLNEAHIFTDDHGVFEEKLIAPPGSSIIKVRAVDKFGKETEHFIHVYLPPELVSPLPDPSFETTEEGEATEIEKTGTSSEESLTQSLSS